MNLLKDICNTFCDGLAMREVPIGYAIRTPFKDATGDAVAVYARRLTGSPGLVRLEDDGSTIATLQEEGFGVEGEPRHTEFLALLAEHSVLYDEEESLLHTEFMGEERLAPAFLKFMSLMLRVADLRLLSRERVRETFKADIQAFVEETFSGVAQVERDAAPSETLSDYIPDAIVRAAGATLAVYACSSEVKALEAFVLWQELLRQGIGNVIPMVILETAKPPQIKARTLSRLMNSNVVLASMDGGRWDVAHKLRERAGVVTLH